MWTSKERFGLVVLISTLLLIPCFWLPIVSTADLQSHLYNAWLAQLVEAGRTPGLRIVHQSTNVAVDLVLAGLVARWGASTAERALTAGVVLVFFWGAFRFIRAAHRYPPYCLAPWLAVLSYGYVFQLGLLNFYLSAGVVLWALALSWDADRRHLAIACALGLLAATAHPIPPLWLLAMVTYRELAGRSSARTQGLLFFGGVVALYGVRRYVLATAHEHGWSLFQLVSTTGADQALLFGWRYAPPAVAIVALLVTLALTDRRPDRFCQWRSVLAQLYGLTSVAIALVPSSFRMAPKSAWVGFLSQRLSLFSFVLLLAVLGARRRRATILLAGFATAGCFFGVLHGDVAKAARIESKMESLVSTLPFGQRLVACVPDLGVEEHPFLTERVAQRIEVWARRIPALVGWHERNLARISPTHLISRACVGRCFDFMNYEPASQQFRIRASAENSFVASRITDVYAMESGFHPHQEGDGVLHAVYRCGSGTSDLCMRALAPGVSCRDLVSGFAR
ncbi:MAG: hypothetical protein A2V77_04770 [Anaeromyxobacter sp. RBG_16_69_14]|nr:MAG: hypothetical protein A2V77_04770 [Anaeromyxobacter sp. RBG_16_69_14]